MYVTLAELPSAVNEAAGRPGWPASNAATECPLIPTLGGQSLRKVLPGTVGFAGPEKKMRPAAADAVGR
jgi:hypothetical protein